MTWIWGSDCCQCIIELDMPGEIYVDWIGDAECEDQARDLYRIGRAKIIGNSHENPELLCAKK